MALSSVKGRCGRMVVCGEAALESHSGSWSSSSGSSSMARVRVLYTRTAQPAAAPPPPPPPPASAGSRGGGWAGWSASAGAKSARARRLRAATVSWGPISSRNGSPKGRGICHAQRRCQCTALCAHSHPHKHKCPNDCLGARAAALSVTNVRSAEKIRGMEESARKCKREERETIKEAITQKRSNRS